MRIPIVVAIALFLPAAALAATQAETRIADGFTHLGMAQSKAACYGGTISGNLDPQQADRAASIVESASTGKQLRELVLKSGSNPMVHAFSAAADRCGK